MLKFPALALAFVMLASTASAQTVTIGTGTVTNTSTSYPAPFGNYWGGARHQILVTAAELTAAGASAGNLVSLGFDVVNVMGAPLQGFTISVGHTLQAPSAVANATWETGLTLVHGPTTHTTSVGWNTQSFSTPFAWNGVNNIMLETCFNNMSYTWNCSFNQTNTGLRMVQLNRADNTPTVCTDVGSNYGGFSRPNMQLTFAPPPPLFQVNQSNAYMDFDFVYATAGSPAITNKCVGATVNACMNSSGMLANVVLCVAAVVPTSYNGGVLNNNNVVNLDLSENLIPLLGAFAPIGNASGFCPIYFAAEVGTLSAQLVSIDPTSAISISLSQACQLTGHWGGALTLPNADDATYLVDLSAPPFCLATGMPFYGTNYMQIQVSTNGVICPGSIGQAAWTPSAAAAQTGPGSVGIWSDWQSNAHPTASIVVQSGAFNGVEVLYTNVPYWGSAVTSSFAVCLNPAGLWTAAARILGISTLGTHPTATGIILSRGGGLATDPGMTTFGTFGVVPTANPTSDMLYKIGSGSPALGGGANNINFNFNSGGCASWHGY